jgi:hypothetical protein
MYLKFSSPKYFVCVRYRRMMDADYIKKEFEDGIRDSYERNPMIIYDTFSEAYNDMIWGKYNTDDSSYNVIKILPDGTLKIASPKRPVITKHYCYVTEDLDD